MKPRCKSCKKIFSVRRVRAGYKVCLDCGEKQATEDRKGWCVAPMHKSNYMLFTDKDLLVGLNNKGGLVK